MDAKQIEISTILIELDALLDTRIATIASLGDKALDAVFASDYHNRLQDVFEDIDSDIYNTAYKNRDKVILADAIITPMGQMLNEFTFNTLKQVLNTPFHYQPKILLNIHPYVLTETEINVLINSIIGLTHNKADVEVINVNYEQISPSYIKQHISVLILYEYYKWLEIHSLNGKFKKVSCPEVTLLGPAIYFTKPAESISHSIEAFEAMQTLAAPLIGLRLLPIENFSLVFKRPDEKKSS